MAKGKPMGWKMRITIVVVVLLLVAVAFLFTPWGYKLMKGWLDAAYEEAPASERRTHWSADWWLNLAWWEGVMCGRRNEASAMYEEFLGILRTPAGTFREFCLKGQRPWNGKFDPKTLEGWGILHERAPEAYLAYVNTADVSKQETSHQACFYKILFDDLYGIYSKSGKPHPKFYVHWPQLEKMIELRYMMPGFQRPGPPPPGYEGPPKG